MTEFRPKVGDVVVRDGCERKVLDVFTNSLVMDNSGAAVIYSFDEAVRSGWTIKQPERTLEVKIAQLIVDGVMRIKDRDPADVIAEVARQHFKEGGV